ncbi:hypothetical protein C922_05413 [Plasmodium inui San Antonio 1]|uniref:Uncharacterized protein n=1 Tax=Plasmodium inui San Antonio 1 TaxID=1237626 RepID=W6ZTG1_9APIC|nr:hypothetical protein C922_05413 [Plasmodium inui San Antonio 1]EUD64202.1 hypothetical protein C922_05413 [Plasmodium inui San Antonio 1]
MPEPYYYNVYKSLLIRSISPLYYVQNLTHRFMKRQISTKRNRLTIPPASAVKIHKGGGSEIVLKAVKARSKLLCMEKDEEKWGGTVYIYIYIISMRSNGKNK